MNSSMLRRARRRLARGVTLIEILIVLAIIGLIAGAISVAVIPKLTEARKEQAKNDALALHPIAEKYRADRPGDACPTIELLKERKELSNTSKITDPWETPYKVVCTEDEVFVVSFGPDKKEGTADDIKVPSAGAK